MDLIRTMPRSDSQALCLSCDPGSLVRSRTRGRVANWIREQGRLSAVPPNAPSTSHPVYNPSGADLAVSVSVGGPHRKVLWWGATPRPVGDPLQSAPEAYGYYTNMGIASVEDGVLSFRAQAPQPYYEEGVLWPPHFHYVENTRRGWSRSVQTVAGFPGHSEVHDVTALPRRASDRSSVLTPANVRKHQSTLTLVNALPMQYANISAPDAKAHLHVPYDAAAPVVARAASRIGDAPYVVYCEKPSCDAGTKLIARLVDQGATNVHYMPAGRQGWARKRRRASRR